jgi:hypothetical protein
MQTDVIQLANCQTPSPSDKPRTPAELEGASQRDRECIAGRVASAISELRNLQDLLLSDEVDPRLLTDFRDALNRTRNTAWAVQQHMACLTTEADSTTLIQILAAERIRVTYQLGQGLLKDLEQPNLRLQAGQLLELYRVMKNLTARLAELVG